MANRLRGGTDQRGHFALVAAIHVEIGAVHGEHGMTRVQFENPFRIDRSRGPRTAAVADFFLTAAAFASIMAPGGIRSSLRPS